MNQSQKRLGAMHLRTDIALLLLNEADHKGVLKKAAHDAVQAIIKKCNPEEYKRLLVCKNVLTRLADKLIECEDEREIVKTLSYVDALRTGDVYIAADGQEIITE